MTYIDILNINYRDEWDKVSKLDALAFKILNSIGNEFENSWYNMVDEQKNEIFENLKIMLKSEIKD